MQVTISAPPGPLTLVYPRWLPGDHAIEGRLENISRLAFSCDGKPLEWRRDLYDAYAVRLNVPEGGGLAEAAFDCLFPTKNEEEVFLGVAAGKSVAILNPSAFALAPECDPNACIVTLRVRLPKNWFVATALTPVPSGEADTVAFASASLYTVIDSPMIAGMHRKTISLPIAAGDVPHTLELYAESEAVLEKKEVALTSLFSQRVAESGKLFGVRHYRSFHFLLALSPDIGRNGLEHHESSLFRRESKGTRSLDDFCRLFFGGPNRGAEIIPYSTEEVLDALNKTQPHQWNGFLETRFYGPPKGFPADGLEAAGWRFILGDAPDDQMGSAEGELRSSLGFKVTKDGQLSEIILNSPADRAGVTEEMTILGANGFKVERTRLRDAVKATQGGKTSVELLLADGDTYRTARLDYESGEQFPSLVRDVTKPDLLKVIATPAFPAPPSTP